MREFRGRKQKEEIVQLHYILKNMTNYKNNILITLSVYRREREGESKGAKWVVTLQHICANQDNLGELFSSFSSTIWNPWTKLRPSQASELSLALCYLSNQIIHIL